MVQRRPQPEGAGARGTPAGPEALGAVLSRLFAARGYGRVQADAQLQTLWRDVAGERIAKSTRVMGLKNGVLTIGVDSSPLLSELSSFHRENLLEGLKSRRGESIRDLKFKRSARSK
ncbi:MAG: DUF721 domain-containing protein [Planctomyces sp.]|nr:DUF721 domain-containing protein [Planctomyces sp.]